MGEITINDTHSSVLWSLPHQNVLGKKNKTARSLSSYYFNG
jgi:hypothetical protein